MKAIMRRATRVWIAISLLWLALNVVTFTAVTDEPEWAASAGTEAYLVVALTFAGNAIVAPLLLAVAWKVGRWLCRSGR
jgi:hypothetical protein